MQYPRYCCLLSSFLALHFATQSAVIFDLADIWSLRYNNFDIKTDRTWCQNYRQASIIEILHSVLKDLNISTASLHLYRLFTLSFPVTKILGVFGSREWVGLGLVVRSFMHRKGERIPSSLGQKTAVTFDMSDKSYIIL